MALSAELGGRQAVVTGASSGIGRAVAAALARADADVLLVARSPEGLHAVATDLAGAGGVLKVCPADVATEEGVARVVDAAGGPADIVVHAAGAFDLAPLWETEVSAFDAMLAVNLRASFLLVRAFVPGMLGRGRGDVVTIGSIAGRQAFPSNGAYSASKFGVRGMHAVLAAELRGTGVRATFVEPSATDTPLWETIDRDRNPGLPEAAAMLGPEAVADAVVFAVTRPRDVVVPNLILERA
ncbi:MAG TPA: SDR family oxidoreductase [Longimicrobiales bacterium]|nr:SDR family oxidoreductase [Longimicrobiales bacterium]